MTYRYLVDKTTLPMCIIGIICEYTGKDRMEYFEDYCAVIFELDPTIQTSISLLGIATDEMIELLKSLSSVSKEIKIKIKFGDPSGLFFKGLNDGL